MTTRTTTLFLCGCTTVEELLENPFNMDLHCDLHESEIESICVECGDCKLKPKQIRLTLSVEEN